MDCPTCQGNGELEEMKPTGEKHQDQGECVRFDKERVLWPNTCHTCGGSGFLDVSF
ncbi:hypothetical protein [Paenibacillus eucommiae]|uniref:DnaJ-class molecular chaperone n=1 Tax=Paenibacillus eucommiae TaxID=1355755 RepID=A0ABS4J8H2_9BACL|nr:hypothetical protein [Paenibacillus eucommiae]MBP1996137.1 DnaJ-class molecular chaperone [Paenibacillus eucommiae]